MQSKAEKWVWPAVAMLVWLGGCRVCGDRPTEGEDAQVRDQAQKDTTQPAKQKDIVEKPQDGGSAHPQAEQPRVVLRPGVRVDFSKRPSGKRALDRYKNEQRLREKSKPQTRPAVTEKSRRERGPR